MSIEVPSAVKGNANGELTDSIGSGVTSPWYIMPKGTVQTIVDLIPVGGTARIEFTNQRNLAVNENVPAGDEVIWQDGDVSVATSNQAPGIAALRVVTTGGTATLVINCVLSA